MKFNVDLTGQHLGVRLDVFLAQQIERSRAHVQGLLAAGRVRLSSPTKKAEPSYRLRIGDEVELDETALEVIESAPILAERIPLEILFEDHEILALNKPPGLVVHPAVGHRAGTLVNALLYHCGAALAARGGETRLGIVHRLDKDTSGVMVVAKTERAHEVVSRQFAERTVRKFYAALCAGEFRRRQGSCRGSIGRHPTHRQKMAAVIRGGRAAHTDYRVLAQYPRGALVECELHTGRTHQIRVHLTQLGHPVLGDTLYGRARDARLKVVTPRQMLHAVRLGLAHPKTGKWIEFTAPTPNDFALCLERLKNATP